MPNRSGGIFPHGHFTGKKASGHESASRVGTAKQASARRMWELLWEPAIRTD
jgi:hypothetical protein